LSSEVAQTLELHSKFYAHLNTVHYQEFYFLDEIGYGIRTG